MRPIVLTATIFLTLAPAASRAQMVLPGAVAAPTPVGQSGAPPALHRPGGGSPGGEAAVDRHFAPAKPPSVDTIVGKPLSLSGARGVVQVEKSGADLRLSRLTLVGDKISQPNQTCEVTMGDADSLALKPMGAPDGVQRYELDASACPLQFDVLNGALRATSQNGACAFPQADCRADAAGLWGPPGDSFDEAQVKSIERERTVSEKSVSAHFRSLLAKNKKDKAATQAAVKEQAAFSASRAQTCRDYDREEAHGFCDLRLTEARDYRLQTRLAADNPGKQDKKVAKSTAKPAARKPAAKPATEQQGGPAF
ncbi:hypothetical protein [Rhodoblastus sp.]|uniref:hypothetical protein n=2 Tax=Rhodoblastus sp. TaxID=1962975 RepID=UPI003F9609B7